MDILNKFKNLDKYTKLSIIIILIGIIIRFYLASIHHVAGDACWQLSNSRFIAENLKFPLNEQFGRDEPFWAPPLFHIVAAFVYIIFNSSEFAVRMISPVFGSLSLMLLFLIANKLFDKKTAFYSIIFFSFIPIHVDYSVFSYIDGMLSFLVLLSVYFALNNKIAASGITAGLAILTKYNGIFILPVLFYIVYSNSKDKRIFLKNALILFLISLLIGSIWFMRNWHFLGNPVWPFMNNIFHGIKVKSFTESSVGTVKLLNIFNINAIKFIYFGIFGVPDGNISTLHFFNVPYINILFVIWLLGTFIFSAPFAAGLISKKLKHRKLLFIWIASYIILVLLYVVNASWSVSRFMLSAFPAIALIWGHGIENLKNKKIKNIFIIIIALIILGFISTSFIKISLAAKAWNFYNDDFKWVKANTGKSTIFLSESQCISYNIGRQTASPDIDNLRKADYVLVNQNFKLDRLAIFDDELLPEIKNRSKLVYSNEKTETAVYKLK